MSVSLADLQVTSFSEYYKGRKGREEKKGKNAVNPFAVNPYPRTGNAAQRKRERERERKRERGNHPHIEKKRASIPRKHSGTKEFIQ
jgi:hypothetical protein